MSLPDKLVYATQVHAKHGVPLALAMEHWERLQRAVTLPEAEMLAEVKAVCAEGWAARNPDKVSRFMAVRR